MENKEEEVILTLSELLDQYESGELIPENNARKVYLSEEQKAYKRIAWIHDHELRGQALLRRMGTAAGRDLLRQPPSNNL
jgi:hypothetical protein